MELFRPNLRALIGAIIGAAAALVGGILAEASGQIAPFTVLLVLAIPITGLGLGAGASLYTYIVGALILLGEEAVPLLSGQLAPADVVRFAAFLLGAPFIVLLVRQATWARIVAEQARDAAQQAQHLADDERTSLMAARAERERALIEVERERARLEEVAEAIPEPLIVYDDALRGTYGNRAALRLLGRSFVERPLDEWGRIANPRDEHGTVLPREQWPQSQAQREAVRRRLIVRIPMSGRDLMVDVEGTPIPGGGCVVLLRDVGKEEDQRRRLSRFASFVAHELRNPLAVAKARIELAHRDPELPERAAGHAIRALESVDAAIGILQRLELYSRADAGGLEAHLEPFALRLAIESAVERLRARGSDRELHLELSDGLAVLGDRQLAEQAITNLLTNADRYSRPGGPIQIEARDGDPVTVRVIDSGPGIADDVAERVFRDRVSAGRGLGLGLFLVHAMMSAMGGSVELEQRRPQAVFALRLPRAGERATPE